MSFYIRRRAAAEVVEGPLGAGALERKVGEGDLLAVDPEGPFQTPWETCAIGSRSAARLASAFELPAPTFAGPLRVAIAWVVALDLLAALFIGAGVGSSWGAIAIVSALLAAAGLLATGHRRGLPFALLVSLTMASQAVAHGLEGRGPLWWPALHGLAALQLAGLWLVLARRRRALLDALGVRSRAPRLDWPGPGVLESAAVLSCAYVLYMAIVFAYHRARFPELETQLSLAVYGAGPLAMLVRASLYVLLALAAAWILRFRRALPSLGLGTSPLYRAIGPATVLYLSIYLAVTAADSLLSIAAALGPAGGAVASFHHAVGTEARSSASAPPTLAILLYAGLLGPVTEEIVFRGLLYTALRRRLPIAVAMLLSALCFAALHPYRAAFVQVIVVGLLAALVFERTRSLWPSILAHALWNLVLTLRTD